MKSALLSIFLSGASESASPATEARCKLELSAGFNRLHPVNPFTCALQGFPVGTRRAASPAAVNPARTGKNRPLQCLLRFQKEIYNWAVRGEGYKGYWRIRRTREHLELIYEMIETPLAHDLLLAAHAMSRVPVPKNLKKSEFRCNR